MTAQALDLADRLQTPVFVMTDLDLGMNDHLSAPMKWDDERKYDRGKVLSAQELEDIQDWGRYLDVDGDGIPYRTLPGSHPSKGAYFTRGTSKDEYAKYTEFGEAYVRNVDRLLVKWKTAATLVPGPIKLNPKNQSDIGMMYFGTTGHAAREAMDLLRSEDLLIDGMRIRSFPFTREVEAFIQEHEFVFIVEQNRDAQLRTMLIQELDISSKKLISVLNYNGLPITADFISRQIREHWPVAVSQ